jgi:hypothetical protein
MCSRISSLSPGVFLPFVDYVDLMLNRALPTVNMGRRIAALLYNLTKLLVDASFYPALDTVIVKKAALCLDACLLRILNLRGNVHTVMMDTWICSSCLEARTEWIRVID